MIKHYLNILWPNTTIETILDPRPLLSSTKELALFYTANLIFVHEKDYLGQKENTSLKSRF